MQKFPWIFGLILFSMTTSLYATVVVTMHATKPPHQKIGTVTFKNKNNGVLIIPHLKHLSPGLHGFHLHQNPSCKQQGMSAGGHYDPHHSKKHLGPDHFGHLGDLPALIVNKHGDSKDVLFAPNLHESDLLGRALVIHAKGDNYSDVPKPLGGGGARVACGVIKR